MSQRIDLQRFFRWLSVDRSMLFRFGRRSRHGFAPLADTLETRRLLSLSVLIDDTNKVQITPGYPGAVGPLSQSVDMSFNQATSTYTFTSYNSESNFFVISDFSVGLTVSTTAYSGPGNPSTLTIVQLLQNVSSITLTTGDAPDTVTIGRSPAPLYVNTGASSDTVTHTTGNFDTLIHVDGGSGDDTIVSNYVMPGAFNIAHNIYGSAVSTELAIDTTIAANASAKYINLRTNNVENVQDNFDSTNSNLTITINGMDGLPNGGFMDRTALTSLSVMPFTNNKTVHLFGYEADDDIQLFEGAAGPMPFVGIRGQGLPRTDLYNMDPTRGILRLRTLGGDDVVKANAGVEDAIRISVEGGDGDDYVSADATLIGGAGDDTLEGGAGNDSIDGGLGDDIIVLTGGTDTYVGGGGFDTVYMHGHGGFNHNLSITQNQGVPAVFFENGVNSTVTLSAIDQISVQGSAGNDSLTVSGTSTAPVPILAFMGAGADSVGTTSASAEHVVTAYGEAGQDMFDAGAGLDIFYGGEDADRYDASAIETKNDIYDGGSGENVLGAIGSDMFLLDLAGVLTLVNGGSGSVSGFSVSRVKILSNAPGSNDVVLQADAGDNTILVTDSTTNPTLPAGDVEVSGLMVPVYITGLGPGDNLTVSGNAGSDSFTAKGSAGANLAFQGGVGMDTFHVLPSSTVATFGGNLSDVVSLSGSLGNDSVDLTPGPGVTFLQLNGTVQTILGVGRYVIETWGGNDDISLSTVEDLDLTVDAGEGDDLVDASGVSAAGANVRILGGDGVDYLNGPTSGVTVVSGGLGNDTIVLIGAGMAFGDGGDDFIGGSSDDDTLDGGEGNDYIDGRDGDDTISTGPGFNEIFAGAGFDVVTGGINGDVFYWSAGDESDLYSGGGGGDILFVYGADATSNLFEIARYGSGMSLTYDGMDQILAEAISWVSVFAGSNSDAEAVVGDLSDTSVAYLELDFAFAGTAKASVSGSLGNDDLTVATSPVDPLAVSIAGLSYQLRYVGEFTGLATELTVEGLAGDDRIKATEDVLPLTSIVLDGGQGDDELSADATLIGGSGDDTLVGGSGDDSLIGNDGDDLFLISSGNDSVDGGAGFDILRLVGSTGAANAFTIDQSTGLPASIQVNALSTTVDLVDVDQISVQGSTGADSVVITGDSMTAVPIFATLGLGNDQVDANLASAGQRTDAYGEGGEDYFLSGPGTDYFYGGDDFDKFDAMYDSRDSFDFFDGGSGYNDLYVEGSAFGSNVIAAIPSGFRVTNTNGTGVTTALNIGHAMVDTAGLGVYLYASNGDDVIRTFDSTSDLVPALPVGQLLVTGMPGEITLLGVIPGTFVDIHGEGGDDTFQSLGNAEANVNFYGDSGADRFIVTQESKFASFTGGAGTDTVAITGTVNNDSISLVSFGPGQNINYNGSPTGGGSILEAEVVSIDALAGDDNVTIPALNPATGLAVFEIALGAGNDFSSVAGLASGVFEISGGEGYDAIFGSDSLSISTFRGDGGDDLIVAGAGPVAAYGGDGNDNLSGSNANDILDGGAGNDTLLAGRGNDQIDGGPDQDLIIWYDGDGNDNVAGGTGQDALIVAGDSNAGNAFELKPQVVLGNLFEVLIAGNVIGGGEIEHVRLAGGGDSDNFAIDDLSQTSITLVDIVFGNDDKADTVSVLGTAGRDYVVLSGSDVTTVNGLPWLVRVDGAQFSATTLIDGILFDGNLGEDTIVSSVNLTNPVLVTIKGGGGPDDIRINSPSLGDNVDRVVVDTADDIFGDIVQLRNGRTKVVGSAVDVILVNGSENDDLIEVLPEPGGRTRISVTPTGLSSSNDLSNFSGVVHVDGLGGNDEIAVLEALRATVWGGDGNDEIVVGPAGSLIHGGSGDDQILGGSGDDTVYAGAGNDSVLAQAGNDILFGEAGDDLLEGGLGLDNILGGDDSDLLMPGKNGAGNVEFVDGGGGLDQIRFDLNARSGLIGHTAGFLNVGEFGGVGPTTAFNAVDAEDLLIMVDSTVPGSTGYDLTIYDLTGTQVSFARVNFLDPADQNTLALRGTIAADVIDANYIVPPGGSPEAQVLMPWGTVWAYTPGSATPLNTLAIAGDAGDDVIKVSDYLSLGAFAWNIQVDGEDGNDYLSADATITGGAGNDTLVGGSGGDSLAGNDGDDLFLLSGGLDTFVGGAGFDIVHVSGSVGAANFFVVTQNTAVPVAIDVNATNHQVDMTEIDQISVQGSTGEDTLLVGGTLASPIDVLAMMGEGYDQAMTYNASAGQFTTIYGQEGNDVMISGPGTDFFFGGDDYDYFSVSTNSFDSTDWFDGGSGYNELLVYTPPAGTTTVTAIPSGFLVTNSASVGSTTALNIGYLEINGGGGGGGIVINGSNNDDTIRTFDSTSDLVPPLPPATMLIAGLGADINIFGIVPGQTIDIHGQGGNDTFQSLGNAQANLTFLGDSGDDRFVVTQESKFASFVGGAGTDSVLITGTVYGDSIDLTPSGPGQIINYNGNPAGGGLILAAEVVSIDALAGNDNVTIPALNPATGLAMFEIALGAGNDFASVAGLISGTFSISGGEGNDSIFGPGGTAVTSIWGDGGNDQIVAGAAPITAYGGDGNDNISGSSGNDTLDGGAGDDSITAGLGNDHAFGGPDQDFFFWNNGSGDDTFDGGTGQDSLYASGNAGGIANTFELSSQVAFANLYQLLVNGARIEGGEVEHVSMVGGGGADSFAIGDLSQTAVTLVDSAFGLDDSADRITVLGTADDDTILLTGVDGKAEVTGLPWLVRVRDIQISGDTLVDGVVIDGSFGYDRIRSGYVASSPMLITINGGQGADFIEFNTPNLGNNVNRGTIQASNDFFADRIRITNGRTIVYGGPSDVIEVIGTENVDLIDLSGLVEPGRVVFGVNGVLSSNDLTNFAGVIHVNALGASDTVTLVGYGLPTSVMGGLGNDQVDGSGLTGSVSIYGEGGDDTLFGGLANDFISGGQGYDFITGYRGFDVLEGDSEGDYFYWNAGDGDDYFDGGTGENVAVYYGYASQANGFRLSTDVDPNTSSRLVHTDGGGTVQGTVDMASVQLVSLIGGSATDAFEIGNLKGTAVTSVDVSFGLDTVTDILRVNGTDDADRVILSGGSTATVSGLPWTVRATGAAFSGPLLVDTIEVDTGLGDDTIHASSDLLAPVLLHLADGRGYDEVRVNTGPLGSNPYRVTIDSTAGISADLFRLYNGRNRVLGNAADVIAVDGTANVDLVTVTQTLNGTVINVNGSASTNDLTNFLGVMHVDLMGGNDEAVLAGYAVPTSVTGGDGNDLVNAALMTVPISLYGGSGDDSLTAGSANDYLSGGDGNDRLIGGQGNDSIDGGAGDDFTSWVFGDGSDTIEGGSGANYSVFAGHLTSGNVFMLKPNLLNQQAVDLSIADGAGLLSGIILASSVGQFDLTGGTGEDRFTIEDLTGTSVTKVNTDFGVDTVADRIKVFGTANDESIKLIGAVTAQVTGLPWVVSAANARMNGDLLVDGVDIDAGLGYDYLGATGDLGSPVLVTLNGGRGSDIINAATPYLGVNPVRVVVDASAGTLGDIIRLLSGRNQVLSSHDDLIIVDGSVNNDTVSLTGTVNGVVFDVNGRTSTNDLAGYLGVIHVELVGGNDTATLAGYDVPTSVMGGDGSDRLDASAMTVSTTLYGGSGNDTFYGGSADDEIDGGSGNDDIRGNHGIDSLSGGEGNDNFAWFSGDGLDYVDGGEGDDWAVYTGTGNMDNVFGVTPLTIGGPSSAAGLGLGNSNRVLVTHNAAEIAHIGDLEALTVNGGNDCDSFGIGNLQTTDLRIVDVVFSLNANGGVVSTWATNLPDTITVVADSANQIGINGLAVPVRVFNTLPTSAIVVHAGFGSDNVEVDPQAEAQAIIVVDGGAGNDAINGGSIIIGGPGNNVLIGTDGPNTIVGGTGSDSIYGLGAGDTLFGDAEVLNVDIIGPDCKYIENLIILPTTTGAPDLIEGGDGDDFINGNIGADSIYGGEGNDEIGALTYKGVYFPEPGNDQIDAGEGDNCVFSGDGNDSVKAGNGSNRIVLGEGDDTATAGNGNNSVFGGAGNDNVTTGSGNDLAVLGAGNDNATLGNGNDIAWGEDGNDFIIGQYGNDSLYGGSGNDILWGGLQATPPLARGQKHAPITPFDGNDVLAGNDGFDQLDGGNGDNIMDAGADYIRETMVGSGGWDTAFIHKDEGRYQDVLKNHSRHYTLIPYGSMLIPVTPVTPADCDSPIIVNVPNPLAGALSAPPKKKALPKASAPRRTRGR